MNIDRATVKDLREQIQQVIDSNLKVEGLSIHVGNATFTPNNVVFKVECSTTKDGVVMDKDADNFKRCAFLFGLKEEWFGQTFKYGEKTFKIVGLRAKRGTKYPVIAENEAGKRFKFPADFVKTILSK